MKENRTELRASEQKEIYIDMFLRIMKEEKILTEEEYIKAKRMIRK